MQGQKACGKAETISQGRKQNCVERCIGRVQEKERKPKANMNKKIRHSNTQYMRVNNKCDTIRLRREVEKEKRWLNDARQGKKTKTTKKRGEKTHRKTQGL